MARLSESTPYELPTSLQTCLPEGRGEVCSEGPASGEQTNRYRVSTSAIEVVTCLCHAMIHCRRLDTKVKPKSAGSTVKTTRP